MRRATEAAVILIEGVLAGKGSDGGIVGGGVVKYKLAQLLRGDPEVLQCCGDSFSHSLAGVGARKLR